MATRQERQREHVLEREREVQKARRRDETWRAYCPVHGCSVATTTEGEAQHCRRIHNDGCDERAATVERITDGSTTRVCIDCGHVAEQRFGFVDGRIWRCFVHGEPNDERSESGPDGGDTDA